MPTEDNPNTIAEINNKKTFFLLSDILSPKPTFALR
jgi:hypothetical protein